MNANGDEGSSAVDEAADPVARLLRQAGHRPQMAREAERRLHANVHASWQASVARRRRRRRFSLAAAALVLMGGVVGLLQIPRGGPAPVIATVAGDAGQLQVERAGQVLAGARELRVADRLVVTGARGAVLRVAGEDALELRLSPGTRAEWTAAQELRLLDGALYLDASGDAPRAGAGTLRVQAGSARIEHLGTQYLAQLRDGAARVAVREGTVRLASGASSTLLKGGEVGQVSTSGQLSRLPSGDAAPDFRWADALAAPVAIEGRRLAEVVGQLARQAGVQVEYADAQVERAAREAVLHGPALSLPPEQALRAIVATSGFGATTLPAPAAGEGSAALRITTLP